MVFRYYDTHGWHHCTTKAHSHQILLSWAQENNFPKSHQLLGSRSDIAFLDQSITLLGQDILLTLFHTTVIKEHKEMEVPGKGSSPESQTTTSLENWVCRGLCVKEK